MDEQPPEHAAWRALRASVPGQHGRRGADRVGWGVRVIRDVGFPIVVAYWLLTQLPSQIDRVLARDQELREEQNKALVATLTRLERAVADEAATVREATAQSDRFQSILLDRAEVLVQKASEPQPRPITRITVLPTPAAPTTVVVQQPAPAAPAVQAVPQTSPVRSSPAAPKARESGR